MNPDPNKKLSLAMGLLMNAVYEKNNPKKEEKNKSGFRPLTKKKKIIAKPAFKSRRLMNVTPAQYRQQHLGRTKKVV